ncbi:MAG: HD domain-containing phosphohydrolase [Desulfobulbales bacterium]|nr:HD domain-containing phosphohydrolase [Desulfobulbales bacterium]
MPYNYKDPGYNGSEALLMESLKNYYFIYSCNRYGEVVHVSTSVLHVLGYTQDEFLELTQKSGQHFSLDEKSSVPSADCLLGNKTEPFEIQILHKDGSQCWLEVSEFPMCDENGSVTGVECIIHNITDKKQAELNLKTSIEKLRNALAGTIQAMALTVETRDAYTAGHQRRSANLARAIAQKMGLSEYEVDGIRMAGVIHDIGKISIPAEILSKPGALSDLEFSLIKTHPQVGYDILKGIDFQWPIADIVLQHHERLDGSGYPHGISGDDILIEARVLAVSDVVEAMTAHRPYRPTLGIDAALEEISTNKDNLYDAAIVDTTVDLFMKQNFKF